MPRAMNAQDWAEFEAAVRRFCELRSEYRRRKELGTTGSELDGRMVQALNALELDIERMRAGNELDLARRKQPARKPASVRALRAAQ